MNVAIYTFGNMVADVIVHPATPFPPRGQVAYVERIAVQPGGNAVNTAIALGLLGTPVAGLGRVGSDGFGDFLLDALRAAGVRVEHIVRDRAPTAVTLAGIYPDAERSFVHALGANASVTPADIPWDEVARARIFHMGSLFALPAVDGAPGAQALRRAKTAGLTTVLDVCWDAAGRWMDVAGAYLPHADYFLPNLDEARALTGREAPEAIAERLLAAGCGTVVIKLGPGGCYVRGPRIERRIPGIPVAAVDATGAGDAFGAGFMAALLRGHPVDVAARFANAVGAKAVSARGSSGLGAFEAIWRFMEHESA